MARQAAIAAYKAAVAAAKAIAAAIKAIAAAIKELIAAIAAGGWVAVVVIIVICLIGLIVGILFRNLLLFGRYRLYADHAAGRPGDQPGLSEQA